MKEMLLKSRALKRCYTKDNDEKIVLLICLNKRRRYAKRLLNGDN